MVVESELNRKRPLFYIHIDRLKLDPLNPRLPLSAQGKSQTETLHHMYNYFDLTELADSMTKNGYFDEEPVVAVPESLPENFKDADFSQNKTKKEFSEFIKSSKPNLIVVEGNRRLATIQLLLSKEKQTEFNIKGWYNLSHEIEQDLREIPVIVYPKRGDMIAYLGVRHITGIKKWEPYAKARYIASMAQEEVPIEEIQQMIGDRGTSVRKIYFCYKLIEIMEEESEGSGEQAKDLFSYLILALGQGPIKEYLGVQKEWSEIDFNSPIPQEKIKNLQNLFSFLFGEGKQKRPVIRESRDITSMLTHVLSNKESAEYLERTRNLEEAYDRSDGEQQLLIKQLEKANREIEKSLGIAHRYKNEKEITALINKCKETVEQLLKNISD